MLTQTSTPVHSTITASPGLMLVAERYEEESHLTDHALDPNHSKARTHLVGVPRAPATTIQSIGRGVGLN